MGMIYNFMVYLAIVLLTIGSMSMTLSTISHTLAISFGFVLGTIIYILINRLFRD
jgi:hypothetical protein